eukprot:TRINITY_DN26096_c0_g1_i1.p1 TRINITY_DN26096_c0_g1~~TRINITY_DN26096_c0_g1_i1.p1  ORF type:complete len:190 (+),score=30.56 TRINITY_DN26096_c0_g1_i1:46-570(+)
MSASPLLLFLAIVFSFALSNEQLVSHFIDRPFNAPSDKIAVLEAARSFLHDQPGRGLMAEDLFASGEIDKFFVIDIRNHADFCAGHLPSAVNIPFRQIVDPDVLPHIPTDRPLLIQCYTGHTASQANAIFNLLGYNTYTLMHGYLSVANHTQAGIYSSEHRQIIFGGGYPVQEC